MKKDKTAEDYIALYEMLERDADADSAHFLKIRAATDEALSAGDTKAFLRLLSFFSSKEDLSRMSRSQALMRLRYLITAVENETKTGFPLFIDGVRSFDELTARYTLVTLLLRRLEFHVDTEEAYAGLRKIRLSPYAAAAVLYSPLSLLGHREEVLLLLSADALNEGRLKEAYGFLSVVESPGVETAALKQELAGLLRGGV